LALAWTFSVPLDGLHGVLGVEHDRVRGPLEDLEHVGHERELRHLDLAARVGRVEDELHPPGSETVALTDSIETSIGRVPSAPRLPWTASPTPSCSPPVSTSLPAIVRVCFVVVTDLDR
jgi:hypothetical protein